MAKEDSAKTQFVMGPDAPVQQMLEAAPVIYVDGAVGFGLTSDGLVRFNLYQDRLTADPGGDGPVVTRAICLRLMMTRQTAASFQQWLLNSINPEPPEDGEE